jgi:two-component system NtrC family sensor kinase
MQFIGDNIDFLRRAFASIGEVFEHEYFKETAPTSPEVANLRSLMRSLRLPHLMEQIPLAIQQSSEGVDRVTAIIHAMQEFTPRASDELTPVDINHAIESSLEVTKSQYKYVAEIQLDLSKELPMILCSAWEFKQALVNLIINATHAIEESVSSGRYQRGSIAITTRLSGASVEVIVKDNGCGIAVPNQKQIFVPFFTTKAVGKGTGQGLPMVRSIIENALKGSITFTSTVGEGTEFKLTLPINQVSNEEIAA